MLRSFDLDTSVVVPLFVSEPASATVRAWFEGAASASLLLSGWVCVEFTSVIGVMARAGLLSVEAAAAARDRLRRLLVDALGVVPLLDGDLGRAEALRADPHLAPRSGDALHVAIASRAEAVLLTRDRRLGAAMAKLGRPCEQLP